MFRENVLWNKLLAEESFTDAADDVFSKAANAPIRPLINDF